MEATPAVLRQEGCGRSRMSIVSSLWCSGHSPVTGHQAALQAPPLQSRHSMACPTLLPPRRGW